jgi:RNA polymerase sigma-70 factor (ECF subfamily)
MPTDPDPAPPGAPDAPLSLDDALVLRAGRGDAEAFARLVERHQAAAYRYCWRVLRNHHTAEDLAQEFFVRLFRSAARYLPAGHFTTWMYRILTNLCFDALRRRRRRRRVEAAELDPVESEGTALEPVDEEPAFGAGLERAEARDAVHAAVCALPTEVRKVLELREFERLPYAEIARILGVSVSEVKVRLQRARKLLARALGPTPVGRAYGLDGGRR